MKQGVPLPLTHNVNFNHVLHERVLLVAIEMTETPRVDDAERVTVTALSDRIARIELKFGFMEKADVPEGLQVAVARGQIASCNCTDNLFYRTRDHYSDAPTVPQWRNGAMAQSNFRADASQCTAARCLLQYS
jgi:KUP system potassium uptake protein